MGTNDLFTVLQNFTTSITDFASANGIQSWIIFGAGILIAALIGLFAVSIIRFLVSLMIGGVGYFVGLEIFSFIAKNVEIGNWLGYVIGGVCALALFLLALKAFPYAYFIMAAYLGYVVGLYYFGDNSLIAIGVALLIGFLAVIFVRLFYIVATSLSAATILTSFTTALLPATEWLEINAKSVGFLGITLGLTVVFIVVQSIILKKRK